MVKIPIEHFIIYLIYLKIDYLIIFKVIHLVFPDHKNTFLLM